MSISVLLADDQLLLLRDGLRMIIEAQDDLTVTGEGRGRRRGHRLRPPQPPDVVLMDIRMPSTIGIEATRRIIAANLAVRVLVLTTFGSGEYASAALRAGASGFLLKDVRSADLITAIRAVASGNTVLFTRRLDAEHQAQDPSRWGRDSHALTVNRAGFPAGARGRDCLNTVHRIRDGNGQDARPCGAPRGCRAHHPGRASRS